MTLSSSVAKSKFSRTEVFGKNTSGKSTDAKARLRHSTSMPMDARSRINSNSEAEIAARRNVSPPELPGSSFYQFIKANKTSSRTAFAGAQHNRQLAQKWEKMESTEKAVWEEKEQMDRERYKQEINHWRKINGLL